MQNHNQEPLTAEYWANMLRPVFDGKKIILTGSVIAGLLPQSKQLKELGAESTFMLSVEGMGTGDMPSEDDDHWFAMDPASASDLVDAIHTSQARLGNLPKPAKEALDWYDPNHEAMIVGSFLHEHAEVAGRKSLAYRKPEWLAIDDKTVIDSVWDKIGVAREPSEVVPVNADALREASAKIDKGDGVVWSGDSKKGISGGANGVRWIRTQADADKALPYYQENCDSLRVMPFLEGVPCSIHGMVFPDYVAAFRPVEMVVLRKVNSNQFFYAGTSTYWDPKSEDREAMRATAKQVGEALHEMVDYKGLFTIDGVMTKNGFRPTEMNTRSGAGIKPLLTDLPNLPIEIIAQALMAGAELDYRPQELESLIITSADANRGGGTWAAIDKPLDTIEKRHVKRTENGWQWSDDANSDGTVSIGPGPLGSFVRLDLKPGAIKPGDPLAFTAKGFWKFIDENTGSGIGVLDTAKVIEPIREDKEEIL